MWTSILIAFFVGGILWQVFIAASSIWASSKLFRVSEATFLRCVKIGLKVFGVMILVSLIDLLVITSGNSITARLIFPLVMLFGVIGASGAIIKRRMPCSTAKATGVAVVTLVLLIGLSFPTSFALKKCIEAYVMPTGSMAPTIIGNHTHVQCNNCGQEFDVSMSERIPRDQSRNLEPGPTFAVCPNCNLTFAVPEPAHISGGDRFLVNKLAIPRRWENVAYWAPVQQPNQPRQAYIKRLVGLPNESLDIIKGDIFIDSRRLVKKPDELLDLWIPIYDSHLIPKEVGLSTTHWQPEDSSGWDVANGQMKFVPNGNSQGILTFKGKLSDRLGYNATFANELHLRLEPENLVGDVRIDCDVSQFTGQGSWGIRWQFAGRDIHCRFSPDGGVELACQVTADSEIDKPLEGKAYGRILGDTHMPRIMSLAIRDGWAYVLDGGHPCVSLQVAPDNLMNALRESSHYIQPGSLTLYASECELSIPRIKVSRDVYYEPPLFNYGIRTVELPIKLGEKDVFLLGDNSQRSSDSRYEGPSKAADMIGVVRLRYWPFDRWREF